jgi:hypothetical protein
MGRDRPRASMQKIAAFGEACHGEKAASRKGAFFAARSGEFF